MNQISNHHDILKKATYASFSLSVFLIIIKLYAAYATGALSIQASLIDSLVDSFSSLINLIAIQHALRPADNEHRFGHGKIEALAAQGQSIFIAITAIWIMGKAIYRMIHPQIIQDTMIGITILVFTILSTLILYRYQLYVIEKTNSTIIKADSLHYKCDLLLNLSVIAALLFSTHSLVIDAICSFAIGGYILYVSWHIAKEAFDVLLDRELPLKEKKAIIKLLERHPNILGFHDLKSRSSGQKKFIQFHIELDENISLKAAHRISCELQSKLKDEFPNMEIIIHEDPYDETHLKENFEN